MATRTQYYHLRDPIENLCLRIVLRKVAHGNGTNTSLDDVTIGTKWTHDFRWQERVTTRTEANLTLCSYIDADNYKPPVVCQHASERLRRRLQREETFKQMHIVARMHDDQDLVLCSLCFYTEVGLLCMTPGFSSYVDVPNDPDALTKGPRLASYQLKAPVSHILFEYVIDNPHDVVPWISLDDQAIEKELQRIDHQQQQTQTMAWRSKIASGDTLSAMMSIEIVALHGAAHVDETETLYVVYEVIYKEKVIERGETHRSYGHDPHRGGRLVGSRVYGFNFHTQCDVLDDQMDHWTLRFQVILCDGWQRKKLIGCGDFMAASTSFQDVMVPLWKPVQSIRQQLEDFFIGMDELEPLPTVGSRLGLQTESANCALRLRLSLLRPDRTALVVLLDETTSKNKSVLTTKTTQVMKRSVHDIMQAIKDKKRLPPAESA